MEFAGQIREVAQLPPDTLSQLVAKLTELYRCVNSIEDAKYIRKEDLVGVLKPIPARRLVEKLKSNGILV